MLTSWVSTVQVSLYITPCLFCLRGSWCDSDDNETVLSSTTTSTSSVSCSPRWTVYPDMAAWGASRVIEERTLHQCLDACVNDSSCIAAEWTIEGYFAGCWIHDKQRRRSGSSDATHFEIVRQCYLKSCTCKPRHHLSCNLLVQTVAVYFASASLVVYILVISMIWFCYTV